VGSIQARSDRLDASFRHSVGRAGADPSGADRRAPEVVVMRGTKFPCRGARLHSYSLGARLDQDDHQEAAPE
jgi:hypothetical protein